MHIVLGLLGAVITILILIRQLNAAGIDIASFNPFLWHRRRHWAKNYHSDPAYSLRKPMEAVALLLTAQAKSDGDMSREQKIFIKSIFEHEFNLQPEQAQELIASSVFLLRDNPDINVNVAKVLSPSLSRFSQEKAIYTLQWLYEVADIDGTVSSIQQSTLEQAYDVFDESFNIRQFREQ